MKGRNLLMIPGPIEFSPRVLAAMAEPTTSHVAPDFIACFGDCLHRMKEVFMAPSYQPFVVAGSGTLAMDLAAANLVEPGDEALIINSGYFSDRMADIMKRYGASITVLHGDQVGDIPSADEVQDALEDKTFQFVCITQVDTSTGVLADVKGITKVAKAAGCLTLVDGVCGTGGAECRTEEWGVDVYFTASQKALGVPPGLALLVASDRAMEKFFNRKDAVANYYADFANWLPIMKAYAEGSPAYFGTPPVNLINALKVSLDEILTEGMENRLRRHRHLARAFRAGLGALGFEPVPVREELLAPTLTAAYYPKGVPSTLPKKIIEQGVITATGLHPKIKDQYFRVGHMGICNASDIISTLAAIERALVGEMEFSKGAGVTAAQSILYSGGS